MRISKHDFPIAVTATIANSGICCWLMSIGNAVLWSLESKKMEGKAAGVRTWIVKPFQPPTLLDAVAKLVM